MNGKENEDAAIGPDMDVDMNGENNDNSVEKQKAAAPASDYGDGDVKMGDGDVKMGEENSSTSGGSAGDETTSNSYSKDTTSKTSKTFKNAW